MKLDKLFAVAATATRALGRMGLSVGVARAFGAEGFATYALLLVVETIALTLASSRAQGPLMTLAPGKPVPVQGALLRALLGRLLGDLGFGAVLLLATLPFLPEGLPSLLVAFGASTATACLSRLGQGWRLATFSAHRVFLAEACALIFPVSVCVATAFGVAPVLGSPLVLLYLACALGQGIGLLWLMERTRDAELSSELQAEVDGLAKAMLLGSCVYSACSRVQPFALSQIRGLAAVAPFAAALTVAGPLRVFSAAVDVVLRPRLAAAPSGQRRSLLLGAFAAQGIALCVALFVLGAVGEFALDLLYGDVIPGLQGCALLAALYVGVESFGSTLTVAAQVEGAQGAQRATRSRVWVSVASLVSLGPAAWLGGAAGAFVQLVGVEALFVGVMVVGLRAAARGSQEVALRDSQPEGEALVAVSQSARALCGAGT